MHQWWCHLFRTSALIHSPTELPTLPLGLATKPNPTGPDPTRPDFNSDANPNPNPENGVDSALKG